MPSEDRKREADMPSGRGARALRAAFLAFSLAILALLTTYLTEVTARRARSSVLAWATARPLLFLSETAVFFALAIFLICLCGRPRRGVRLMTVPALVLSAANLYKLDLRGEPMLLTDFMQLKEALLVMPNFRLKPYGFLFVSVALLGFALPRLYGREKLPLGGRRRAAAALLSGALALGTAALAASVPLYIPQQTDLLFEEAGWVRALWETRPKNLLKKPEDYGREAVLAALEGAEAEPVPQDAILPDLYFIMSESLFDPARLEGLETTGDPLEELRPLLSGTGCDFIAPHLGGGTFYSEYEVLTGYRSEDTPGALFNDRSVTEKGMETLATVLKDAGYQTSVMHPNGSGFYSRGFNYGRFGFDRLLFSDTGLPEITEKVGPYPADAPLFRLLLEDRERQGAAPQFYYVITYQNHGDYKYDYGRRDVLVTNREGAERRSAENYLNALMTHAGAVSELIAALREKGRPSVVVLFGDHAPNVGEFGLDFGRGPAAAPYYRTPLLIWTNTGADLSPGEEAVAAYRLGALVLARLGIRTDAYFGWLAGAQPDLVESQRMIEEEGVISADEARYEEADRALLLLHYDRLKGEDYWKEAGG